MNLKKELNTILFVFCMFSVIFGVLCVVFAEEFAVAVPYIIGALVVIDGIYTLIKYFLRKDIALPNNFALAQGLINIVLGILILLSTEFFATAFGIFVAICLLVYGLFQLNMCVNFMKTSKLYIYDLIESILLIVFAILLLIFSGEAIAIVITIMGAGMIVIGVYIAVKSIIQNKKLDEEDTQIVETTVVKDDDNKDSNKSDNANNE